MAWVSTSCEPVERRQAMKIQDFKKAVSESIGVCLTQVGPILRVAGINPNGVPNSQGDRVAVGPHPVWTRSGPAPGLRVNCSERGHDEAQETLTPSFRSEADDILGCWLAPVETAAEAMTGAQVRDAISSRADVSTRLVGEAMGNAGWEEVNWGWRAADGRKTSRRVYRHHGDRSFFARVRSRSPRRE